MSKMLPLHLLRPGTYKGHTFTAITMAEIAASYDPALKQAPLVKGHPADDDPAYGWVVSLSADADGNLFATDAKQIDASFSEEVHGGSFKYISVSLYTPTSSNNPTPGRYYLKHVGFLGAKAPAVSGLRPVEFSEDEGVLTLSMEAEVVRPVVRLFRRMRDWMIEQFGIEKADEVLSDWEISILEEAATAPPTSFTESPTPNAPTDPEPMATPETPAPETVSLAEREADLSAREAALTERETKARREEHERFLDGLAADGGRVLPAEKAGLLDFMEAIGPTDAVIELTEGNETKTLSPVDYFKAFLSRQPQAVSLSEVASPEPDAGPVNFSLPPDASVDPDRLDIHEKAVAYSQTHNVPYEQALRAVL